MSTAITSANLELETLLFERDSESDGAVAIVTINRPEAANSLNDVMCRDLLKVAIACDEDPSIRTVLLTKLCKFDGQRVGRGHLLADEDIVELHT